MSAATRAPATETAPAQALLPEWEGVPVGEWARRLKVATAEFHERTGSTSDRAAALVRAGRPLPVLVVADRQTAGRGRRGRRWASDSPSGLWFTAAHAFPASRPTPPQPRRRGNPSEAPRGPAGAGTLPLRIGLAVARAVESAAPDLRVQVKWPNDLLVAGRKLGGVLCERAGAAALAGVGLNLNHPADALPTGPGLRATSIAAETGRPVPRDRVLEAVWAAMETVWPGPARSLPPSERAALDRRSPLTGRPVTVDGVIRLRSGRARAVRQMNAVGGRLCPDGSLELVDPDGAWVRLVAGSARPR